MTKSYTNRTLIRDGDLVAEVQVKLADDHEDWRPTMSIDDATKVDMVRQAMRAKDYDQVRKLAKLYRLVPVEHSPGRDTTAA